MSDGEPQVIDMDSTMDEDKAPEEKGPENMDHDGKKMEDPPAGQTSEKHPDASVAPSGQHKSKATTVVFTEQEDLAAAGTQEDFMSTAEVPHHVDKEGEGSNSVMKSDIVKPVVLLTQTGMAPDGSAMWRASMLQSKIDSGTLNKTKALSGGVQSPVRASKRNASTSEQDSLEKATKLKARRNMNSSSIKGKEQPLSFDVFDDSSLLAYTSTLGISLGANEQEVTLSLQHLRDIESTRMSESNLLKVDNSSLLGDASTVCSVDEDLDLDALNLICAKISEDLGDGGCDPLCLQTPISHLKKSRSKNNKKKLKKESQ